jgi:hypothetical protein
VERRPTKKRQRTLTATNGTADTVTGGFDVVVGIGNLRVIVVKRDNLWFARGLDINYAAQGVTLQEVKRNFERGLEKAIDLHLKEFGNIDRLLSPTPPDAWRKLVYSPSLQFDYSQVSTHRLSSRLKKFLRSDAISFIRPQMTAVA